MAETDLVADILQRLVAYHHLCPAEVVARIDAEVRRDWGGERHYIQRDMSAPQRMQRTQRDKAILADVRRGERFELLSRRYNISIRRIRQIIAGAAAEV